MVVDMNFDVSIFIASLFKASQQCTFFRSLFTSASSILVTLFCAHRYVYSAYSLMRRFVASGSSFINIRKRIGSSIDTWGIPFSMNSAIDLMLSISKKLVALFQKRRK